MKKPVEKPGEPMVFDRKRLKRLKRAYQGASDQKLYVFTFDEQQLVTSYAQYLIEYLETWLYPKKKTKT